MQPIQPARQRQQLGAWYTPPVLVDLLADWVVDAARRAHRTVPARVAGPLRVLDPACGDGRLLSAVGDRLDAVGIANELVGCDLDRHAVAGIADTRITAHVDDALTREWSGPAFDVVIANPPFLSQMAAATSRGGASAHGGGPYADAAVEFLALGIRLVHGVGGVVGVVMPQSVLGARDAASVRADLDRRATLAWSWWEPRQGHFDATVNVALLGFVTGPPPAGLAGDAAQRPWTAVVVDRLGIPALGLGELDVDGTLAERAVFNANFRDEYYALVPAVSDAADGPPLVTSGLIDPGVCWWGTRPVRFAKRTFAAPRVDLAKLDGRFPAWAQRKLAPKVLVANQTRVVEAVADPHGQWLPGVPVTTAIAHRNGVSVWELLAVLSSPVVSVLAWHAGAGTGLATTAVRVGPAILGAVPWPAGSLDNAAEAAQDGDLTAAAVHTGAAFGLSAARSAELVQWWANAAPTTTASNPRQR